jgi:multicomponent K+:H+ antiporter subunit D
VSSGVIVLLALSVVLALYAQPMMRYTQATVAQLQDTAAYQQAVLGQEVVETVQPYQGGVGRHE